ncbi:DNA internalization-related competence protein ComEC/Rec2 [Amphritea sp. 1_MG-2023]|uniref:DNA internalization-related competence protein ComEC/Rec2 n=1 Tax=Amphritea sp. 1_MG-2023 TaxID=3062670 RepID=UPI0026E1DBC3|nr:DNA internalization-related competence protein ComEC/Rec2 [Amphritea sp. 1_MG-2023]MDO6562486.1 DNA internalization-related competence protein ComEC/Rec2 [Amphritea sp. 1_MG-2023]
MISIALGVMLVAWLPQLLPYWMLVLLTLLLIVLLIGYRAACLARVAPRISVDIRYHSVGVILGVLYASAWGYINLNQRMPLNMSAQTLTVVGSVSQLPESLPGVSRFRFAVDHYSPALNNADLKHLLLSWYKADQEVIPGQQWSFLVRLKPPRGLMNPGSSDYETRLFADQVNARGYVKTAQLLRTPEETGAYRIAYWRYQLSQWLTGLSLTARTEATVRALVLGDKHALQDEQWQVLRQTGTVHLVVISGLHIGIACLLGYGLGWFLQVACGLFGRGSIDIRLYRILPALLLASGYALLAGFSIPTQRALIMALAMLLPVLFNRHIGVWQRYKLAMVLVVLMQPLSVYQPGFWLSFMAVAALLLTLDGDAKGKVVALLATQWAVFLGLLPLLLLWLGQVALIAPLINLVAIPLLTFVLLPGVMLGLLLCVFVPFPGVALLDGLTDGFWFLLQLCIPPESWGILTGDPGVLVVLLGVLAAALLILPRWSGMGFFGLCLLLALIFPAQDRVKEGRFRATVVDIGQGLSVLIETSEKALVFDSGAAYKGRGVARFSLVPLLKSRQITRLDRLILSHKDNDHAGGYVTLQGSLDIAALDSGSPELQRTLSARPCVAGTHWQWNGVRFSYIHPTRLGVVNENNRSCVLLVQSEQCALLIPGDIESNVERQILTEYPQLAVDWLVAAHHGSRFSSSTEWLRTLHPDWVLFSAGFDNPYGHPAAEVLKRMHALQLPGLNTAAAGALLLESTPNGCLTESYRQQKKRYWTAG